MIKWFKGIYRTVGLGAGIILGIFSFYYGISYKADAHNKEKNNLDLSTHVETIYGTFDVTDKVIIDLIDSPAMQRTKNVHQYGIAYFLDNYKFYTRYEHSVGVWAILKRYGVGIEEQIAGLLHDASHTIFSHLGDYIFNHDNPKNSYQDAIHGWYLNKTTVPAILKKHGFELDQVMHKNGMFHALEQDLPDLCADRIEYNIKGGLIENLIALPDIEIILQDLHYEDGRWYFTTPAIASKFSSISLYLTEHEWGTASNFLIYTWAAVAVRRAMAIGLVSYDDVHFSTDDIIWRRLIASEDPEIRKNMQKVRSCKSLYIATTPESADHIVKTKFRGVNPWVKIDDHFVRLVDCDRDFAVEYNRVKQLVAKGWPIKLLSNPKIDNTVSDLRPLIA